MKGSMRVHSLCFHRNVSRIEISLAEIPTHEKARCVKLASIFSAYMVICIWYQVLLLGYI